MKKSLLAVAAMGAFASAAQAQSSVTVYGILDVGYIGSTSRAANNAATNTFTSATNAGGAFTQNNGGFGDSAQSTSRLGFKGTEDLGGGTSAFFTIETSVAPNGATGVFGATGTGNRQTFVGLKKNGIGSGAIGTQYTTIHTSMAVTDPGQQNNMMGNLIYDKWAGFSAAQTGATYDLGTSLQNNAGNQNNISYTVRSGNMLRFDGENFAGFTPKAFYVATNNTNTQGTAITNAAGTQTVAITGGVNNNTGWGLGLDYTWKKLLVTANYQTFKQQTAAGTYASSRLTGLQTVTPAGVPGGFGGASQTGGAAAGGAQNGSDAQQYYAGTYDFGILKAYAQYINRKWTDINLSTNYWSRSAQQIGVRSFITPTIEAWASGSTGRMNAVGSGGPTANLMGWQLGSNYWLSKRTNLYAMYGVQSTSNVNLAAVPLGGTQPVTNPSSYSASNYAVGVRHTF